MSESLLGVILATSSTRGSHIVFRWPNNPKLFKRYSKVKYFTDSHPQQQHLSSHHHHDDELDPLRQKAKWDRNDEDDEDHHSEDFRQSDTPSSSDVEDSDASGADEDESKSVRGSETAASHSRSKAAVSASRSKSKVRRPLVAGLEENNYSVRSGDRVKDTGDAHDKAPDSDAGTTKELSPEEKARREEKAARAYKTYLGYDVEILASILNPRLELAHQKFELVVDDVAFLGHPVAVSKTGTWREPDDVSDGNEGEAGQGQSRGRSGLRKEIHPNDLPDRQNSPNDSSPASSKPSRSVSQSHTESTTDSSSSRSTAPLTQFHLVLVLDRPDPSTTMPRMDLSSWLQLYYDNIVFKMTAALFAEQSKADYVGRETEKLLALRERCMDDGQAYAAYAAQCLGISSLARSIRDLHKSISTSSDALITINDRIEVHLQLPPILQDPTNLTKTIDIETELDPNDPIFLSGGGFAGLGKEGADQDGGGGTYDRLLDLAPHQLSFEEWCRTTGPYLLPWKTLLLLHDQADELHTRGRLASGSASPAGNASPSRGQAPEAHGFEQLARNFTSLFRPNLYHSLNFSQVADMLGWDLYEDVYPMIRHLIYYRQARVIDIPRTGHVYAISPLFDFARLPQLSRIWARTFPDLVPLPVFLSQLSASGRPMNSHFPVRHQREQALDVLVWLLRRDVVIKMHIRLRLMATEAVKRRTAERRQERHERHRRRKEKKRERLARMEARKIRKSQMEEQKRRREADLADWKGEEAPARSSQGEKRGRSRDRDRSRSADTRRKAEALAVEAGKEARQTGLDDSSMNQGEPQSGLSKLGLKNLNADDLEEVVAAAAAIAGSDAGSSIPRQHHHHHHRRHHHHHKNRKESNASDSDRSQHPVAIKQPFDELKFERRPVLRSRSPSTAHTTVPALSVSFSNLADRQDLPGRPRADTTSSSNSSNHPHSKAGLSMTPNTSQRNSRPTTPNVAPNARMIPSHVRDRSIGGGSNVSSSAEGSVPRRTRRATSAASVGGRKAIGRSRSPSRARMRVRGFGVGAEVEIDEEKSGDEGEDEGGDGNVMEEPEKDGLTTKMDLLKLDVGSKTRKQERQTTKRRISTASERPELPPPSESGGDEDADHSDACTCSKCSTHTSSSSSSGSISTSDFSLSSSHSSGSDSDAVFDSVSSTDGRRPPMHRSSTYNTNADEDFSESLIVEPSRASRRENEYIATMVADKDPATVKKFFRLLPYLNGKHTIDEIEYRVKMRRRDIRRLLSVFRDAVITFMHP